MGLNKEFDPQRLRKKSKIPEILAKDGKKLEYKPDMQTMKLFEERDYMDALSYIGVLPE